MKLSGMIYRKKFGISLRRCLYMTIFGYCEKMPTQTTNSTATICVKLTKLTYRESYPRKVFLMAYDKISLKLFKHDLEVAESAQIQEQNIPDESSKIIKN